MQRSKDADAHNPSETAFSDPQKFSSIGVCVYEMDGPYMVNMYISNIRGIAPGGE
jgi:hypothetical protein